MVPAARRLVQLDVKDAPATAKPPAEVHPVQLDERDNPVTAKSAAAAPRLDVSVRRPLRAVQYKLGLVS
jgi:hypothetical protein